MRGAFVKSRRGPARTGRPLRLESLETRAVPAVVFVNTGADDGPGSLRAAIGQANGDTAIDAIVIRNHVAAVNLESSLGYTGTQSLRIRGNDTAIQPVAGSQGSFDLLEATGGADLTLESLTFQNGLKNVDVIVPAGATGEIAITLNRVAIRNSVEHGLHFDDITNATAASLRLDILGSVIAGNGSNPDDFDGIRVDERGAGDIVATFSNATVTENGGDGIELDERNDGSVRADVRNSAFTLNGSANAGDLEDGFDVDEGGPGDLIASVVHARFNANFEGGLDLNEDDADELDDAGNLIATLIDVDGNDNGDKGLDFSEGDGGSLLATFVHVGASRNGTSAGNLEEGIVLEEAGIGHLIAVFHNVTASGNGDDGIDIDESGDGDFVGLFANVTANDNGAEGIDIDEADDGTFTIVVHNIVSNDPLDIAD